MASGSLLRQKFNVISKLDKEGLERLSQWLVGLEDTVKLVARIFIIFLTAAKAFGFVELEDRKPVLVEDGYVTPFWAQEYVGADLVKTDMRKINNLQRVPFAIYDSGFEKPYIKLSYNIDVAQSMDGIHKVKGDHGTSVANIINGPGMISTSEMVDYVQLKKVSPSLFYYTAISELKELTLKPMVISNSMGWGDQEVLEWAKEVDQLGVIWVMAAGNEYPEKIVDYERLAPAISVGSYSPRGLQTVYSQESDQLDILAPGDEYEASINGSGEKSLFGATSGATPLVSGTVANMKAILPGLTRAQVESILKKSAIRSFHSLYLKENKTGLLNAYKTIHVVQRLRGRCQKNAECLQTEISNESNYKFAEIPLNSNALGACQSKQHLSQEEMISLRQNFFLNPEKTQYAKLLSCAYKNEGYTINADNYANMALIYENPYRLQEKIRKQAVQAVLKEYRNSPSLRDLQILDQSFRNALLKVIAKGGGIGSFAANELLERYDKTIKVDVH